MRPMLPTPRRSPDVADPTPVPAPDARPQASRGGTAMVAVRMKLAALVAGGLLAGPAAAVDPATLARSGTGSIAACATCHGANGEGQAAFPRLAGQHAGYLARQLEDFASGRRDNPVMAPIARALAPADRVAIARYYAGQRTGVAPSAPAGDAPAGDGRGAWLATRGAWNKGVPACEQCHGPGGIGVGDAFPSIAAQPAAYIATQLKAFRDGTRANDPQQLMRGPASKLTDAEIDAVAAWFAARPAAAAGGRR